MLTAQAIHWVDSIAQLNEVCHYLSQQPLLGLDTEFKRESTFFPQPALIQMSDGHQVWLIDPVALPAIDALRNLLIAPQTLKILHAASEDLQVLQHWAKVLPEPLLDTQIAQTFCEQSGPMSYQALVQQLLTIELDKTLTRSDWLQRPLSLQQRFYAALDVYYLPKLWQQQSLLLDQKQRLPWAFEESMRLIASARQGYQWQQYYLRQRNLWCLSAQGIAAYQQLCLWRETLARQLNQPRNWLMGDNLLFRLAQQLPKNRYQLAKIEGMTARQIKNFAEPILKIVRQVSKLDPKALPVVPCSPQHPQYRQRYQLLKNALHQLAAQLQLQDQQLLTRQEIDQWLQADWQQQLSQLTFRGWRSPFLQQLRQLLLVQA